MLAGQILFENLFFYFITKHFNSTKMVKTNQSLLFMLSFLCIFLNKAVDSQNSDLIEMSQECKNSILRPSGETFHLTGKLQKFLDGLKDLANRTYSGDEMALQLVHKMKEAGAPYHMHMFPINMKILVKYYTWDSYDVWEFGELIEETKTVWLDLDAYVTQKKSKGKIK
ncbi:hypothetical protein J6590_058645 [Homalodisca vitripennis]|nr:hypothetical protein J6590_058645 [Homalodisca vitripennis]